MINAAGLRRDMIVIGGSAGAIPALRAIIAGLPADLSAAIAIVVHQPALHDSQLVALLARYTGLNVVRAGPDEPVEHGTVYIAPPDRHMRLHRRVIVINRGPKEHYTRPAIDPLFVSAAESFGSAVVGVVLSGVGEDGVVGAIAIKAKSGITLVQSPVEAMYPGMPTAALAKDSIDGVFSADNLAKVLVLLVKGAAVSEDHL